MELDDFTESFFEEAAELLDDMERLLLELDPEEPDPEDLNAIFRAAHSIKGGAGAFGFAVLQDTTHILENVLDDARKGNLALNRDIIDVFLRAKDVLDGQIDAHRQGGEPDAEAHQQICAELKRAGEQGGAPAEPSAPAAAPEADAELEPIERICRDLQRIARDAGGQAPVEEAPVEEAPEQPPGEPAAAAEGDEASQRLAVTLLNVAAKDRELLLEELGHLGQVLEQAGDDKCYEVVLESSVDNDAIEAVLCFIIEPEQLKIEQARVAPTPAAPQPAAPKPAKGKPAKDKPAKDKTAGAAESATIRVHVDKVDQIINLVGELIITQSMLDQCANGLGDAARGALQGGLANLQRNARDLQEAVMSIRMLPMDYVFSRYPRQVRDLAAKLGKEVELVLEGKSTELDKGLIERIIDPLTHLVRNSLDHGIETPDKRVAAGKAPCGRLLLSARHQGGNIIIEVVDDGAGLNREKLLAKARSNGLDVSDAMTDDEVWQLIFAPGFSTAEQVSDVSGRGVGMDVVKRNIQAMGGHVELLSTPGQGTTTRVVLPLTLAILDGMTIRVGGEMFVLPLTGVIELVQPTRETLFTMAGEDVLLKVRDEYLPVVALREVMQVPGKAPSMTESIAVIVQGEDRSYALLVDEPVGQQQVVVKNLESNYRKVSGVAGATILGDGAVALILDVGGLQRSDHARKKQGSRHMNKPQLLTEVDQP